MGLRATKDNWGWNAVSGPGLVCDDRVAAIAHGGSGELVVLAMDDGRLLWTTKRRGGGLDAPIRSCLWQDRLISLHAVTQVADVMTGKDKPFAGDIKIGSCGGFTATARYGMGLAGPVVDLTDGRGLLPHLAKADCSVGNLVASGTFVQAPPACSVCSRVYGFLATRSFPGDDLRRPATDAERLVWRYLAGGRIMSAARQLRVAGCTPVVRTGVLSDAGRAVALAVPVRRSNADEIYGHLTSLWPVTGTPLVANGVVYVAAGQPMSVGGYVCALGAADGKLRWERCR